MKDLARYYYVLLRYHDTRIYVLMEVRWHDFVSHAEYILWVVVLEHSVSRSFSVAALKHVQNRLAAIDPARVMDLMTDKQWDFFYPLFPHIQDISELRFANMAAEIPPFLLRQRCFHAFDEINLGRY